MISVIDIGPDQIWRHHTGDLFEVIMTACMAGTRNSVVVYRPVPTPDQLKRCLALGLDAKKTMPIYVRSMDEWLGRAPVESPQEFRYDKVSGPDYSLVGTEPTWAPSPLPDLPVPEAQRTSDLPSPPKPPPIPLEIPEGPDEAELESRSIDWSEFDKHSKSSCTCYCGGFARTHTKWVLSLRRPVSRKPCPKCGKYDEWQSISSDPEDWTL